MEQTATDQHGNVLQTVVEEFHRLKRLAERAFTQLEDQDFFFRLDGDQNSIHVLVKHLAGNMISRWTDFLTTDGEKPNRNRDQEFIEEAGPREQIMRRWEQGWNCLFATLAGLSDGDLRETVTIRGEKMTAFAAINCQTSHYAYHVGQIVLLARHLKGPEWQYLSVPRGQSEEFNRSRRTQESRGS
jgi:hypothetical protein